MEERQRSRLSISISLAAWTGRGERGSTTDSELERATEGSGSPKETATAQLYEVEEADSMSTQEHVYPLPMPSPLPDIPQPPRNMTEPIRPPSVAFSRHLPRHNSQPPPFQSPGLRTPTTATSSPPAKRTICQKALAPFQALIRLSTPKQSRRWGFARGKRNGEKLATRFVVATLILFCITAIAYIALAFSLPNFPNFLHIVFIGILFIEFACVIKALLNRTRIARKKIQQSTRTTQDGPPAGAIIHGAPNWAGLETDSSDAERGEGTGFDLEEIGLEEALKPVPPAYGMYRGSVRIGDHDIRWVRRMEVLNETGVVREPDAEVEGAGNREAASGGVRPPSYASDGGRVV